MSDTTHEDETDAASYDTGTSQTDEIPPEIDQEEIEEALKRVRTAETMLKGAIDEVAVDGYRSEVHERLVDMNYSLGWCETALKGEKTLREKGEK